MIDSDSIFIQNIQRELESFTPGWIEGLQWGDSVQNHQALSEGLGRILSFSQNSFVNLAKYVLAGDYFITKSDLLDALINESFQEVNIPGDKEIDRLRIEYNKMLVNLQNSLRIVNYFVQSAKTRYEEKGRNSFVNAISLSREFNDDLVSLIDVICDVCWDEFVFSYNESYIKSLLMKREELKQSLKGKNDEIAQIINATIKKLDILLSKLSIFSKNRVINYNYNFNQDSIELTNPSAYEDGDFRKYFLEFIDVERIDPDRILQWQKESHEKSVDMWKYAFLMRYYVKKTKSIQQIDHLLSLSEKHYSESILLDDNIVNHYAARSMRNYMYNSRFSFLCQSDKAYSFKSLKDDIEQIEAVQNETFIYNYHPYEKAVGFIINLLNSQLGRDDCDEAILKDELTMLHHCFQKFKENTDWCKQNQPYLMQMRFNFSSIGDKEKGIRVFYPSSFCRPLRFSVLDECISKYNSEIPFIEYQIKHFSEKKDLIAAKTKIDNIERSLLEKMGLFVTVTTFLVGLLSIFIGNNGSVSIFTKMEYVICLGVILLLFVCLGYFVVGGSIKKWKPYIFGGLTIILLVFMGFYFFKGVKPTHDSSSPSIIEPIENSTETTPTLPVLQPQLDNTDK